MTSEEAINMLYGIRADNLNLDDEYTKDKYESLTMAIKALEQEPCDTDNEVHCNCTDKEIAESFISDVEAVKDLLPRAESEPCEDCISREEAIRIASGYCHWANIPDELAKLPSVTPKPKMGHWIAVEDEDMNTNGYFCSECDLPLETEERTLFCPNCGANMMGNE